MKFDYTFILLALATAPALAQPTLDAGNVGPIAGYAYLIQYATYMPPGTAGADRTWDFSSALGTESHTITFVAAGSTPNGSNFPSAAWAQEYDAPSGYYTYLDFNASGSYTVGTDLAGFGGTHYSNSRKDIVFPLTYNGSWSDTFSGDLTSFAGTGTINGSISGLADGYGTLILPYGTFTNVLRVYTHTVTEQHIVSPPPGALSTITEDGYSYFKPGLAVGLAGTSQTENVSVLGTTNSSGFVYLDEGSTGVEEARQQDIGIDLAPNPASGSLSVEFGATGHLALTVIDGLGRTVISTDLGARAPGIYREAVDVSRLPAGHYLLRLVTDDGQTGMRSFVVDRR